MRVLTKAIILTSFSLDSCMLSLREEIASLRRTLSLP